MSSHTQSDPRASHGSPTMDFMNVTLEATALLQKSEHSTAAGLFRQCLKALRDEELQRNPTRKTSTKIGSRTELDVTTISLSSSTNSEQSLRENVFCFFDRALSVARSDVDLNISSSHVREVLAATILYNMGLCHHHKGIAMNGSPKHLDRALCYYQMAYETINDDCPVSNATALILLALANNMGHIFAHVLDHSSVGLCLESFLSLVSSIPMDKAVLNELDRHFFSFTGKCLLSMQLNSAPAA